MMSLRHNYLFSLMYKKKDVPLEWTHGIIVTLPKEGDLSDCNNWRSITILSIPGKVVCSVLLHRLKQQIDCFWENRQASTATGYATNRSSHYAISLNSVEFQMPLIVNFIDLKKAFESVHSESLWEVAKLYGIPGKYIRIFKALYQNSRCCIWMSNGNTTTFDIMTGVRQGCVLSPFLFLLIIDYAMTKTTANPVYGIKWKHDRLTDLDLRTTLPCSATHPIVYKTWQRSCTIQQQGWACASAVRRQRRCRCFRTESTSYCWTHTRIVVQPSIFESYISRTSDAEVDMWARLGKAASVFHRLRQIRSSNTVNTTTKLHLYKSTVIPAAIYAADTWKGTTRISRLAP